MKRPMSRRCRTFKEDAEAAMVQGLPLHEVADAMAEFIAAGVQPDNFEFRAELARRWRIHEARRMLEQAA